jgi:uncharacterized protein
VTSFVVRLDALPLEGKNYSLELGPEEVDRALREAGFDGTCGLETLKADLRLLVSGQDVSVVGALRTRVRYGCVRCLTPFDEDARAEIHLTLAAGTGPEGDLELHREDFEVETLRGPSVNLTQTVLEQFYLVLRPYPVCRDACLGLCPQCGADRNASECGCAGNDPDPRFAALEKWAPRDRSS